MRSDPGGNFASDAHRRVMAALANPDEQPLAVGELVGRLARDDHYMPSAGKTPIESILNDLHEDGDVEHDGQGGWRNTPAGFEALTGDNADNGGRHYDHWKAQQR